MRLSLVVDSWGCSPVAVSGLLIAVAFLVSEHMLRGEGFSTCGSLALEHRLSCSKAYGIFLD